MREETLDLMVPVDLRETRELLDQLESQDLRAHQAQRDSPASRALWDLP